MVDDAINTWGRLDILVNNAGILRDKSLLKLEPPHFDLVLEVYTLQVIHPERRGEAMETLASMVAPGGEREYEVLAVKYL